MRNQWMRNHVGATSKTCAHDQVLKKKFDLINYENAKMSILGANFYCILMYLPYIFILADS